MYYYKIRDLSKLALVTEGLVQRWGYGAYGVFQLCSKVPNSKFIFSINYFFKNRKNKLAGVLFKEILY